MRTLRSSLLPAFLLAAAACFTDSDAPSGAQITCETNADCPAGFLCNTNTHLCLDEAHFDPSVPTVVPPATVTPAIGNRTTTFRLTLQTSEPLDAPPAVYFASGASRFSFAADAATGPASSFAYSFLPDAETPEGTFEVRASLKDAAGNAWEGEIGASVTFDFQDPQVSELSWALEPPADSPLRRAAALLDGQPAPSLKAATDGTSVTVGLTLGEVLDPASQITVLLVNAAVPTTFKTLDFLAQSGPRSVYQGSIGSDLPEGDYLAAAIVTDSAGNRVQAASSTSLRLDRTPPAAVDVTGANAVVYERSPYGRASSTSPSFRLLGPVGAAEPETVVIAVLGPLATSTSLGAGRAAADGSFSLVLAPIDAPVVHVLAVDGAGNPSPVSKVRRVTWLATLGRKVAGSTAENPNVFWETVRFGEDEQSALSSERGELSGVARLSCDTGCQLAKLLTTAGSGYWARPIPTAPTGSPPAAFSPLPRMATAYDPRTRQVLAFGGQQNGAAGGGTTWGFDGTNWKRQYGSEPPSRYGARMVYDENAQRVLLFGGQQNSLDAPACAGRSASFTCPDAWAFNGAGWSAVTVTGTAPSARTNVGLAFDATRSRTVLFGGNSGSTLYGDTYELNCTAASCSSSQFATPALLQGRSMPALAYDPAGTGRLLLHGGADGDCFGTCTTRSDLWTRVGTSWSQVSADPGLTRAGHSLLAVPSRSEVLAFGMHATADAARICTMPWTLEAGSFGCPEDRSVEYGASAGETAGSYAVYDSFRDQVVVFGTSYGGKTHLWKVGSQDRPAHVFRVALGEALHQFAPEIARVNFQPAAAPVPAGYLADSGLDYGARLLGHTYGWTCNTTRSYCPAATDTNLPAPGQEYDTYGLMQCIPQIDPVWSCAWEYALPNGSYRVRLVLGNSAAAETYRVNVEGTPVAGTTTADFPWLDVELRVTVTDGRLTIENDDSQGALENKIAFVQILEDTPVDGLDVRWYAGASATVPGAQLMAFDGMAWVPLAEDATATSASPARLAWSSPASETSRYLLGHRRQATFAVVPRGVNGKLAKRATITSDYVEVEVRYRLGP